VASANLLTKVLVDKYLDHQPLYRQVDIMKREGVELERSTLADWVGQASFLLQPLTELIGKHVLAGNKVHADDTTAPTLSPGKGKTATGRSGRMSEITVLVEITHHGHLAEIQ
jgi:hypothetical protein